MNALQKARQSIDQLAQAMARTDQARAEFAQKFSAAIGRSQSCGTQPLPRASQCQPYPEAKDGLVPTYRCSCNAARLLERVTGRH